MSACEVDDALVAVRAVAVGHVAGTCARRARPLDSFGVSRETFARGSSATALVGRRRGYEETKAKTAKEP
jgi:hypothetical protein